MFRDRPIPEVRRTHEGRVRPYMKRQPAGSDGEGDEIGDAVPLLQAVFLGP